MTSTVTLLIKELTLVTKSHSPSRSSLKLSSNIPYSIPDFGFQGLGFAGFRLDRLPYTVVVVTRQSVYWRVSEGVLKLLWFLLLFLYALRVQVSL